MAAARTSSRCSSRRRVTFEDLGNGKTRLTWHGTFPSAEERARVIKEYGADKGLVQTMARLADYVAATGEQDVRAQARCRHAITTATSAPRADHRRYCRAIEPLDRRRASSSRSARPWCSSARPGRRDGKAAAALVLLVDRDLHQTAALERLEIGGERGAVHGQQRRDAAERRRFRAVERRQQRELALRETERPQRLVEAPRQRARRALHVQAQAGVAHQSVASTATRVELPLDRLTWQIIC